jgi:hypothetical protein
MRLDSDCVTDRVQPRRNRDHCQIDPYESLAPSKPHALNARGPLSPNVLICPGQLIRYILQVQITAKDLPDFEGPSPQAGHQTKGCKYATAGNRLFMFMLQLSSDR